MRILAIGAGGMLGDSMYKHFTARGDVVLATDLIESEPWLEQLDVRDYHRMHYVASEFRPNVIMNLAAMTDLEKCESSVQEAVDTNTGGS